MGIAGEGELPPQSLRQSCHFCWFELTDTKQTHWVWDYCLDVQGWARQGPALRIPSVGWRKQAANKLPRSEYYDGYWQRKGSAKESHGNFPGEVKLRKVQIALFKGCWGAEWSLGSPQRGGYISVDNWKVMYGERCSTEMAGEVEGIKSTVFSSVFYPQGERILLKSC